MWYRMEPRHSHDREQDQRNGIETVLEPSLRTIVEVEEESSQEVRGEGEEEEVANEALFLVHIPLFLVCQLPDVLPEWEGGGGKGS